MRRFFIYAAALLTLAASCARESVPETTVQPEGKDAGYAFVLDNGVITTAPAVQTKGVIATSGTASSYESRMTEVHVGVYLGGTLVSDYIPGTSPALALDRTKEYDFYAVTAVGDSWTWPSNEVDLSSKAIDILPDLSSYSSKGIPCFGQVLGMRPEAADAADGSADGNICIEVRRLFAKVELDIVTPSGELNPYSISPSDVRVRRINSVLRPFAGGCAAADPSDVRDASAGNGTDHTVSGETSGTMVFYVPENLQGAPLTGNTDSYLKTPGSIDDAVGGVKSQLCTYLEINCSAEAVSAFVSEFGSGQVSGSLAYRFLLGGDNLSDCNVEGGRVYRVTLTLRKKGLDLVGNWKVDNTNMDDRRSFVWGNHWGKVRPGGTAYLTASYGTVSTVKSDFHAPGWGAVWGFDAGSKTQYETYVASGSAVGLAHAHGVNVTCPECGYRYPTTSSSRTVRTWCAVTARTLRTVSSRASPPRPRSLTWTSGRRAGPAAERTTSCGCLFRPRRRQGRSIPCTADRATDVSRTASTSRWVTTRRCCWTCRPCPVTLRSRVPSRQPAFLLGHPA